jgi:hypothetical protein
MIIKRRLAEKMTTTMMMIDLMEEGQKINRNERDNLANNSWRRSMDINEIVLRKKF